MSVISPALIRGLDNVPKLMGEADWHAFKEELARFFRAIQAGYVTSDSAAAVPEAKKALDAELEWLLFSKLGPDPKALVKEAEGGKALWKVLKEKYEKATPWKRMHARKAFQQCRHDPSHPIETHIANVKAQKAILTGLGVTVSDDEVMDVILINLDDSFDQIRINILSQTSLTLEVAISMLTSNSGAAFNVKQEEFTPSLLAVNAARAGRGRQEQESLSDGRQNDPTTFWMDDKGYRWCNVNSRDCHRCGRSGHIAAFCMFAMPEAIKQKIMDKVHFNANMAASMAELDAEAEQGYQMEQAYGTYIVPARRSSPSPPPSPRPASPAPSSSATAPVHQGHPPRSSKNRQRSAPKIKLFT